MTASLSHVDEALQEKLDTYKRRALNEHASYQQEMQRILDDETLSSTGKKARRDALHELTSVVLAGIQAEQNAAIEEVRQALERRVYPSAGHTPQDIIAHRDAVDRARRLTDYNDASSAITEAIRSGDKSLATAIVHRAAREGWHNTTRAFANAYPDDAAAIDALAEIERVPGDLEFALKQNMAYAPPSR